MELVTPGLGLIFWQTIVFVLVLFILGKFVWPPILKALKEREENISNAISQAEKAREEMANLNAANEKLLQEARLERDQMLKDAQKQAAAVVAEAKNKASDEANKLIEKAKDSIQGEKRAAIADIKNQAATLSLEIAEKLLRRELSDKKAQEELLSAYVKEAELLN